MGKQKRIDAIDNCKAFLICCVVIGHLCEIISLPQGKFLYLTIYSFHMPAFVFISGYCCSQNFQAMKILKQYVYPYFVFQTLYLLFDRYILENEFAWQYTRPYWLMWYMMAMIWWNIAVTFFRTDILWRKIAGMTATVVAALLVGFDANVGYVLSLSRVVVFFPFFLAGFYLKNQGERFLTWRGEHGSIQRAVKAVSIVSVFVVFAFLYRKQDSILKKWFYQAVSYESGDYEIGTRVLIMLGALLLCIILCLWIPNRRVPILTYLGQHTMQVYLLHGFVVKWLGSMQFAFEEKAPVFFFVCAFLGIIFLLLQSVVTRMSAPLMRWRWNISK